jgi:hypothetical protein
LTTIPDDQQTLTVLQLPTSDTCTCTPLPGAAVASQGRPAAVELLLVAGGFQLQAGVLAAWDREWQEASLLGGTMTGSEQDIFMGGTVLSRTEVPAPSAGVGCAVRNQSALSKKERRCSNSSSTHAEGRAASTDLVSCAVGPWALLLLLPVQGTHLQHSPIHATCRRSSTFCS